MELQVPNIVELKSIPGLTENGITTLTKRLVKDKQFVSNNEEIAIFESMDHEIIYVADCDGIIVQIIGENEQVFPNKIFGVIKSYDKK